ncbi:acylphosphatase [Oceanobacillus longus]|uniref:acylphosphatase n=1 Tax=Oceanobacillus longus TaxID=930120 RepID=A0ABV8H1G0_9BACI
MNEDYPYWLSKQMLSGVRGFNLCANLVALEGWRRGLNLNWYYNASEFTDLKTIGFQPIGKTFSLSSTDDTHFFFRSRGDKVSNEAVDIGTSKEETKKYLSKAGVPTPEGFRFTSEEKEDEIINVALKIGYPLVLKPTYGSLGKGVITDIQTEEELRRSLKYVLEEFDYSDFLIERYIFGEDYRVYVIEDKVIGAIKRIPANVVGNGKNTVQELINIKNQARKANPHLSTRLIKIDPEVEEFLKNQQLSLDDILKNGDVIYLKGKSNISSGGDSIDFTEEITPEMKSVAINAVKAVPGLNHAGIDLIANDNEIVVIEINATAVIASHLFPMYGKPRNIPEAIIDYYFPETIGKGSQSTKIYFDFKSIFNLLRSSSITQIEVADAPVGELYAKRYVISGKVQNVGYRNWIRNQALQRNLHGYTRNLKNGKVVVVVGSQDRKMVEEFKEVCMKGPLKSNVVDVQEYIWESQVNIGFEIR